MWLIKKRMQPVPFEGGVVVVVDAIEAHYLVSGIKERGRDMGANEACGSRNEIAIHCLTLLAMAALNHGRAESQSRLKCE